MLGICEIVLNICKSTPSLRESIVHTLLAQCFMTESDNSNEDIDIGNDNSDENEDYDAIDGDGGYTNENYQHLSKLKSREKLSTSSLKLKNGISNNQSRDIQDQYSKWIRILPNNGETVINIKSSDQNHNLKQLSTVHQQNLKSLQIRNKIQIRMELSVITSQLLFTLSTSFPEVGQAIWTRFTNSLFLYSSNMNHNTISRRQRQFRYSRQIKHQNGVINALSPIENGNNGIELPPPAALHR